VNGAPLAVQFASLFSHALDKTASVHDVLSRGVRASLVPRLNATGDGQFPLLLALVGDVQLAVGEDTRTLSRCSKPTGALDAAALYKLCAFGGVGVPYHDFAWANFAPPRVQFFAWLLSRSRIPSRSELFKKHVLEASGALCPICDHPEETASHIVFACPFAVRFWDVIGCRFPPGADVRSLHELVTAAAVPLTTASTFVLLCCWNLWKHRNAVVFRDQRPNLQGLLALCRSDAELWRTRLPPNHTHDADLWLTRLAGRVP
jgi:hypothetical protein